MELLTEDEVARALDGPALLDAVADAFRALSAGEVVAPPRQALPLPGGSVLTMPGWRPGGPVVVKLVGVFPGNTERGLPAHPAVVCVLDAQTGACRAVMDADHLTAARTAAAAALSVRELARADARVLAIVGAGVVGRALLRAIPPLRGFAEVRIASRTRAGAERLAAAHPGARACDDAREAAAGADVVCLATDAGAPVLDLADVAPGAHVASVGFHPPGGELDPAIARAGRLFVETREAFAAPPAGCAELAGLDPRGATELGELLAGRAPGRSRDGELTVYKAMGHVAEDAAAAVLALERARLQP